MDFSNMNSIVSEITNRTGETFELSEENIGELSSFKYPKLIPFMKFAAHKYAVTEFGNLMTLKTKAMGGMMNLATIVFTPNEGTSVPFLLIDVMSMKKKRTVFVEYYDCTAHGFSNTAEFDAIKEKFADVPEYDEKEAWYVSERTPFSLIKGDVPENDERLIEMISESVDAYLKAAKVGEKSDENLQRLSDFRDRMVKDGNPSSGVLKKVFGDKGAEDFFRDIIMPL